MSFDSGLFSMESYMPRKGKKNGFANGRRSAKEAAKGFESNYFFEGFGIPQQQPVEPINTKMDQGLPIPELGAEYNTRFGKIGTGFTEAVDPYEIGFKDILTGNGRTGEIITTSPGRISGTVKRGRGRPRKVRGIASKGIGSYRAVKIRGGKGKPLEIKSKEVREREKKGEKVETESRSVYQLLKEGKPQKRTSQYSVGDIARERKTDLQTRQKLQEGYQREIEEQVAVEAEAKNLKEGKGFYMYDRGN